MTRSCSIDPFLRLGAEPLHAAAFPEGSLPHRIAGLTDPTTIAEKWLSCLESGVRPSAVVMLLVPPEKPFNDACVVLTRRSPRLRSHSGQIGFAGGRADPGESTPVATALRELEEELGLASEHVMVHGVLQTIRSIDGHLVFPVLATAPVTQNQLVPSPDEVAELILAPWRVFTKGERFSFVMFGRERFSHLFTVNPRTRIWGMTAEILSTAGLRGSLENPAL